VIQTQRLILRRVTTNDLDEMVQFMAAPEIAQFLGTFTRDEADTWLAEVNHSWTELGYGRLAITDRRTGRLLGRTGLRRFPELDATELGWTLRRDAWGHGYATEAAKACANWAFVQRGIDKLISLIEHGNRRSVLLANRLGMRVTGHIVMWERPMLVHTLTREAWDATNDKLADA
jgi:RimJ/RimL family protein N-acetyltransferase